MRTRWCFFYARKRRAGLLWEGILQKHEERKAELHARRTDKARIRSCGVWKRSGGKDECSGLSSLLLPTTTLLSPLFTGVYPTVVVLGNLSSTPFKICFFCRKNSSSHYDTLLIVTPVARNRTPGLRFQRRAVCLHTVTRRSLSSQALSIIPNRKHLTQSL